MRWTLSNLLTRVEGTEAELGWLDSYLTFNDDGWRPPGASKDRRIRLLDRVSGYPTFPTGFAVSAYRAAQEDSQLVEVKVKDARVVPLGADPAAALAWVKSRPPELAWLLKHPAVAEPITHQIGAVEAACRHRRGVLQMPTGSGKTECAIGIALALKCRWLFVVHRSDLMAQAADRFEKRTGQPAGRIGEGSWSTGRFTCATFQTLHAGLQRGDQRVLDLLAGSEGVMVDEAHALAGDKATQGTFYRVLMRTPAYYRFGLSATPLSRGKASAFQVGALGGLIYQVEPKTLIELGVISQPRIRMVRVSQKSDRPTWLGVYGEAVTNSAVRNRALVGMVKRATKPCLVFVRAVKHGRVLAKAITKAGMSSEFIYGRESLEERRAAVERLERADTDVLVCSVIFQEGVDIPSLRSVVIASAEASEVATVQKLGRGSRVDAATKKTTFEVWDCFDGGCGCTEHDVSPDGWGGGKHTGCRWLRRHSNARIRAFKLQGFETEIEGNPPGELDLGLPEEDDA